jgi:hypothetical protein
MPGARCTHSLAWKIKNHTSFSHYRFTEINRHSLHDGFTVSFVLAPETGLSCLRRP